jgi:hypothetical protein
VEPVFEKFAIRSVGPFKTLHFHRSFSPFPSHDWIMYSLNVSVREVCEGKPERLNCAFSAANRPKNCTPVGDVSRVSTDHSSPRLLEKSFAYIGVVGICVSTGEQGSSEQETAQ